MKLVTYSDVARAIQARNTKYTVETYSRSNETLDLYGPEGSFVGLFLIGNNASIWTYGTRVLVIDNLTDADTAADHLIQVLEAQEAEYRYKRLAKQSVTFD